MVINNYDIGRMIGKGAYASVHFARNRSTNQNVAMKLVYISSNKKNPNNSSINRTNTYTNKNDDNDNVELDSNIIAAKLMIQREQEVHSSLMKQKLHPNIVQLLDWFEIPNKNVFGLVTEYCCMGDLHLYVKSKYKYRSVNTTNAAKLMTTTTSWIISEDEVRHILGQILQGLEFLHSRGIIHRDMKASNIFLCPNNNEDIARHDDNNNSFLSLTYCTAKIGDFGLSVQMQEDDDWDEGRYTLCGTPSCLAPEVVMSNAPSKVSILSPTNDNNNEQKEPFSPTTCDSCIMKCQGHGLPADIWSTGCILYLMLVGRYPFYPSIASTTQQHGNDNYNNNNREAKLSETITKILQGDWSLPSNSTTLSNEVTSLLHQLLSLDPRQRGTACDILRSSSFFTTANNNNSRKEQNQKLQELQVVVRHDNDDILSSIQSINNDLNNQKISYMEQQQEKIQLVKNNSSKSLSSSLETFNYSNSFQDMIRNKKPQQHGLLHFESSIQHHNPILLSSPTYYSQSERNENNNSNNSHISPNTSIHSLILRPLQGLNRLPMKRHQWTEEEQIHAYSKTYTFFMLPFGLGAVLHYEKAKKNNHNCDERSNGIWMHLAGDGIRVAISHMEKNYNDSNTSENNNDTDDDNVKARNIIHEAFAVAPATIQNYINLSSFSHNNGNIMNKTESSQLPSSSNNVIKNRITNLYHPLSSLSNHKSTMKLCKKLYENVISLKQDIPKITLSLIDNNCNNNNSSVNDRSRHNVIGKAMMMENEPFPDIVITFFQEEKKNEALLPVVSVIRYQMSTGIITIQHINNEVKKHVIIDIGNTTIANPIEEDVNNQQHRTTTRTALCEDESNANNKIKYEYYIDITLIAAKECINVERQLEQQQSSSSLLEEDGLTSAMLIQQSLCFANKDTSARLLQSFQGIGMKCETNTFPVCRDIYIPVS